MQGSMKNYRDDDSKAGDTATRVHCGVRIYLVNAEDLQRPRVWMSESSKPQEAAVVAAPIWKLWPRNWRTSSPCTSNAWRTASTNFLRDKGEPSWNWNRWPGADPLRTAVTWWGRLESLRDPEKSVPQCQTCQSCCDIDGVKQRMARNVIQQRCHSQSMKASLGLSPARRKPKKPVQQAAHNITASCDVHCCNHVKNKSLKIGGVTGRRWGLTSPGEALRMPFNTYSSCGRAGSETQRNLGEMNATEVNPNWPVREVPFG